MSSARDRPVLPDGLFFVDANSLSCMPSVQAAIVHYQTPDLLIQAVESFRSVYPAVPLLLLDNGSVDGSADVVRSLAEEDPATTSRMLDINRYHGPAMDLILREAESDAVFFLDSDTITRRSGFLEPMADIACRDEVLACGHVVKVDRRGFVASEGTRVPASAYMMVNRDVYLSLPPFIHHGLPVLGTCRESARRGLQVESFPVMEYVDHLGRGTAERFGYGLGIRSRLSYLLHRLGL